MRLLRFVPLVVLVLAMTGQRSIAQFKTTTKLVVVNVGVKDANGKPVKGLKKEDFLVTEDGKPQNIYVFEYQELDDAPLPLPPAPAPAAAVAAATTPPEAPPLELKKEITPSAQGQVRYKDKRLMVMFFDFSSMPADDQLRAQSSALKFLDTQMTASDLVSIMTFTSQLQVLEDFTDNRDTLRRVIKSFRIGEASELAGIADTGTDDEEDTGAAFVADNSEFNVFNTDQKLAALERAVKMLSSLPEKKALVYFSSGISQSGTDNQAQLRSTINAAVRANTSFYTVDAKGLVAAAPAGNASQGSPRGTGVFSGSTQRGQRDQAASQQETLYTLATDTGGKALLDNNDLSMGIVQAQHDVSSYYILGYNTTNENEDGKYRRIKVTIPSQPRAKLDVRNGYFSDKKFKDFNSSDKERQLEEALALGDPITDLPMDLELNWFRLQRDRYFVPLAVKIPGSELNMARAGKAEQAVLDFIGQVKDTKGRVVGEMRDNIKVKLTGADAERLKNSPIEYDSGFTLAPGDYVVKFLARENVSGKMGTYEAKFKVPDITNDQKYLHTSSVVFANQRQALTTAIGAAERDRRSAQMHPLIRDGQKLIPSITHVYRNNQNLYVYLEVYDATGTTEHPAPSIAASLSFFRGKTKAFETQALHLDQKMDQRVQTIPVQIQVPLSSLRPGTYTCQVNVIDEQGHKFAFSRSPMVLLAANTGAPARPAGTAADAKPAQ